MSWMDDWFEVIEEEEPMFVQCNSVYFCECLKQLAHLAVLLPEDADKEYEGSGWKYYCASHIPDYIQEYDVGDPDWKSETIWDRVKSCSRKRVKIYQLQTMWHKKKL